MYRYHPELELKCNEDGSEIIYLGERLQARYYNTKSRENKAQYVIINRKVVQVGRIVCECWHGMPDNPRFCATRKDKNQGYHYTNLMWAKCGTDPLRAKTNRKGKRSKIKEEDIPVIAQRIKDGDTLKAIATDYNTSDMSISRIKKRMK